MGGFRIRHRRGILGGMFRWGRASIAYALIAAAGLPIAAPSANLFSRPSPTRASHVQDDLEGRVDIILVGGPTDIGLESTVLDLAGETPIVLTVRSLKAAPESKK